MLTGLHFLVTYACNFECDHCFLHCGPRAKGTFTSQQLADVLGQAVGAGTIKGVSFEGGEPMLYYPLVLDAVGRAGRLGLKTDIVTNAYWATSQADAEIWLGPLAAAGLATLTISDDCLHYGERHGEHASRVEAAGKTLGVAVSVIRRQRPGVAPAADGSSASLAAGGVKFRGRAADKLTEGLPRRKWEDLNRCPHEDLRNPGRVHVDCHGNLQLCQGLCMGNCFAAPLAQVIREYDADAHPIAGPLARGGPAELARAHGLPHEEAYVDECHLCYRLRQALSDRFAQYLAPRQAYGRE
ncbi:MAG: radical SAM protein [Phycisphaerae bacterium]